MITLGDVSVSFCPMSKKELGPVNDMGQPRIPQSTLFVYCKVQYLA